MDGNFKAEYLWERHPDDQVSLSDGHGYMVSRKEYQSYLQVTHHPLEVSGDIIYIHVGEANKEIFRDQHAIIIEP